MMRAASPRAFLVFALIFASALSAALEPRQRALSELEADPPMLPLVCPVCAAGIAVPDADLLMRRPPGPEGDGPAPKWQMHAASRDADGCPYPGEGFLSYQADIALCPDCGYANRTADFPLPVPPEAMRWVRTSLTPEMRAAERTLVGARSAAMTDEEIVAFFDRQELLPDTVRTEHYRTWLAAVRAPALRRAEAARLSAWAARREAAAAPRSALFAGRTEAFLAAPGKGSRALPAPPGDIEAIRARLARPRQGKAGLPGADDMAGRILLAGRCVRLGLLGEAEKIYETLFLELRERFLRHEQDPLWPATTPKAPLGQRLAELETLRSDAEKEMFVKAELVRRERSLLLAAAGAVREALLRGELGANRGLALRHAFLTGEFLRRAGDLPLAAEWFTNLLALADAGTPLALSAEARLRLVREEAGDRVNLLSALGRDGELFAKLREINRSGSE